MDTSYSICEGCLSVDRTLTWVNEETRMLFCEIIGDTYNSNHQLQLCWECSALIRRFMRFKTQAKQARTRLAKYFLHHTSVSSLTALTTGTQTYVTIYDAEHIQSEDVLSVTHIKTEESPDLISELGYDAEDTGYHDIECDENILEDEENQVPNAKEKLKQIKSKTEDSFNESDEEPLKCKKESKPRARRKKKEGTKTAGKKGARREKPAGVVSNARVLKKLDQLNVSSDQLEMVVLSWDEVEEERRRALQSEAFTRHEYRCHDCALGFNHRCKLADHMRKHDPATGDAECSVCRVRCRDARALAAHRRRHRLRWRCRTCGAAWSRAAVAADHVAREHGGPPPTHTCGLCGHSEPTLGKLRNHLKNHSERQKCEQCGKTFRDRTSLRTHLFIHKGEKEYACPRCHKQFLFKKAMEVHLVTHDASALLYCHQCDMNFKNQMSYNQHMKYNLKHIDPAKLKFACDACDKKFAKAVRLREHRLAVHLKLTPIACAVPGCDFACSSRPVLRTHTRMLHRNARARRDHVCHLCGKTYTSKKSLEGHLRAHSGERPLRCARCPAAFGYDAALYNHTRLVHLRPQAGRSRASQPAAWSAPAAPAAPAVPTT